MHLEVLNASNNSSSEDDKSVDSFSKAVANESEDAHLSEKICFNEAEQTKGDVFQLIAEDITKLRKEKDHLNFETLLHYSPQKLILERPKEVVNHISIMCNLNPRKETNAYMLCKTLEQIYSCHSQNLILPLSFRQNLINYSLSHNKLITRLNGGTTAGSSYTYVLKWLNAQAKQEISFPSGIVRIVFDNEQVIGKKYNISVSTSTVKNSVITSSAYLVIQDDSTLQTEKIFSPENWYFSSLNLETTNHLSNYFNHYQKYFRGSRNYIIEKRLKYLSKEYKCSGQTDSDQIDELVKNKIRSMNEKVCTQCQAANDPSFRRCTNCKGLLKRKVFSLDLNDVLDLNTDAIVADYFDIANKKNLVKVRVGEPDFLNPNGFKNICELLQNFGKRAGIEKYCPGSGQRKWVFIENDGAIYTIMLKLINNVLTCPQCDVSFYGSHNFDQHTCASSENIQGVREFD